MVVGWYHSHPGFGCWLSGVDINTQQVQTYFLLCCVSYHALTFVQVVCGFIYCFSLARQSILCGISLLDLNLTTFLISIAVD